MTKFRCLPSLTPLQELWAYKQFDRDLEVLLQLVDICRVAHDATTSNHLGGARYCRLAGEGQLALHISGYAT